MYNTFLYNSKTYNSPSGIRGRADITALGVIKASGQKEALGLVKFSVSIVVKGFASKGAIGNVRLSALSRIHGPMPKSLAKTYNAFPYNTATYNSEGEDPHRTASARFTSVSRLSVHDDMKRVEGAVKFTAVSSLTPDIGKPTSLAEMYNVFPYNTTTYNGDPLEVPGEGSTSLSCVSSISIQGRKEARGSVRFTSTSSIEYIPQPNKVSYPPITLTAVATTSIVGAISVRAPPIVLTATPKVGFTGLKGAIRTPSVTAVGGILAQGERDSFGSVKFSATSDVKVNANAVILHPTSLVKMYNAFPYNTTTYNGDALEEPAQGEVSLSCVGSISVQGTKSIARNAKISARASMVNVGTKKAQGHVVLSAVAKKDCDPLAGKQSPVSVVMTAIATISVIGVAAVRSVVDPVKAVSTIRVEGIKDVEAVATFRAIGGIQSTSDAFLSSTGQVVFLAKPLIITSRERESSTSIKFTAVPKLYGRVEGEKTDKIRLKAISSINLEEESTRSATARLAPEARISCQGVKAVGGTARNTSVASITAHGSKNATAQADIRAIAGIRFKPKDKIAAVKFIGYGKTSVGGTKSSQGDVNLTSVSAIRISGNASSLGSVNLKALAKMSMAGRKDAFSGVRLSALSKINFNGIAFLVKLGTVKLTSVAIIRPAGKVLTSWIKLSSIGKIKLSGYKAASGQTKLIARCKLLYDASKKSLSNLTLTANSLIKTYSEKGGWETTGWIGRLQTRPFGDKDKYGFRRRPK